jgi:hypothetical protein
LFWVSLGNKTGNTISGILSENLMQSDDCEEPLPKEAKDPCEFRPRID